MDDSPLAGLTQAKRRSPEATTSVTRLIATGCLDAELAALAWSLVEARVPVVVAASLPGAGRSALLDALLDLLPETTDRVVLRGAAEDFRWLPEARALGWSPAATDAAPVRPPVHAHRTVLVAADFGAEGPDATGGVAARTVLRATQRGYGLAATMRADSLEEILATLSAPPVGATDDELRGLGVALILRVVGADGQPLGAGDAGGAGATTRRRVAAAHYLRPVERDGHGHVQRRPPAVLATWDPETDAFEHFAWGISPELAHRVGRDPVAFDRLHARRTALLHDLIHHGVFEAAAVRAAVAASRARDESGAPLVQHTH
jgi:hypothetical protein